MSSEKYPYVQRENFDSGEIYKFFKDNLIGRKITKITHESIKLDNGYVVKIHPNYGSGFWVDATMPADREREAEEAKRREEARRARNGGTLWW